MKQVNRSRVWVGSIASVLVGASLSAGCVSQGTYDAKVAELEQARAELSAAEQAKARHAREASALNERLEKAQAALRAAQVQGDELMTKLDALSEQKSELARLAADRAGVVSQLEQQLVKQRDLLTEFAALAEAYGADSPAALERALRELRQRVEQTEAALRLAGMELERERRITQKLQTLIDAGTLRVRRRSGRLVIELPGDVHFGAGSAKLTDTGINTLEQVAAVLIAEKDRRFVVEGHTDNQPIRISGFRNNWHLGSTRAEMAREAVVQAGLEPDRVAIASWADVLPICETVDEESCRARNRRVEVLLLPRFE